MAGRIFTKPSPKYAFAVLFVDGGTPMNIGPLNFGGLKRPFFGEKFRLLYLRTAAVRNEEEFWEN